jgi:hypothetical protein
MDVGDSVELNYTVVADVNADPGLYQLDLGLTYETVSGITKTINTKAGIFIGGETDFDVTMSESSSGQTSLSVSNVGNNPALSVTVRVPEQEGFRVTGSSSSIIGNLDKGDYTIVSFHIASSFMGGMNFSGGMGTPDVQGPGSRANISRNFSGSNNLKVLIEYTDTTGTRHTVNKSIQVSMSSLNESSTTLLYSRFQRQGDSTTPLIIAAVVVVAAVILYKKRTFLRKKLKKGG